MSLSSLARLVLLVASIGSPVLASDGTTTDTFAGGTDVGGWTYGPPPSYATTGGNPDDFMFASVDTFAPQLRSTGSSVFTGDYRAENVTSIGVDLFTESTQFPALRECTLMLSSGTCQIYFLGTDTVPQPGAGWKSFDFSFDPDSPTMPAGWLPLGSCTDPDVAWNTVMDDVTEVRFFYGDPTFFFIFDIWQVGADNLRITHGDDPWTDLGGGTSGENGVPTLVGTGPLTPGSVIGLELTNGPSSELILLWIATSSSPQNLFGGTLHAFPFSDQFLLATDASGSFSASTLWPAAPSGTQGWFQFLCQDTTTFFGITLSNGVLGTVP